MATINPLARLQTFVAQYPTQGQAAKALGISPNYLSELASGKRDITRTILTKLGLERVVTYRRMKAA